MHAKSRGELVEELVRQLVPIDLRGTRSKIPAIQAIIFQLMKEATKGNKKAGRLLSKFVQYANKHQRKRRIEVVFVDPDDATEPPTDDHSGEQQ